MTSRQPSGKLLTPDTPQKRTKSKTGGKTPTKSRSAVRGSPSRTPSTVPPGGKKTLTKKRDKKNAKAIVNNEVEIQPPEPEVVVDMNMDNNEEEKEVVIQIEEHHDNLEEKIEMVSYLLF